MIRYDRVAIHATKTDEGFIRDKPIVGRTGILEYRNPDGSTRREYRPPEEAFNVDSLNSLQGKPITMGHQGMVTSGNSNIIQPIGTVLSPGRQDNNNIVADVVIYQLPTEARELSCGYNLDLEETPGVTPNGQPYDAIQRHIRYNHVAVVPKGRAGIARLNMDGDQEMDFEEHQDTTGGTKTMKKVRLDNGIEYDAAPEVAVYVDQLREDHKKQKAEMDTLQAKYDAAVSDLKKAKEDAKQAEEKAKANFDQAVSDRVAVLKRADAFGIKDAEKMTVQEVKKAVIKKAHGDDFDLENKSDEYLNAAYDLVKDTKQETKANKADGIASQVKTINQPKEKKNDDEDLAVAQAMEKLRKDEADAWMKEVK